MWFYPTHSEIISDQPDLNTRMSVAMRPTSTVSVEGVTPNPKRWRVYLDHVDIAACPDTMNPDSVPVFTIEKSVKTRYMTPEAHFYGHRATGVLVGRDGTPRTAREFAKPRRNVRRLAVVLCRSDGKTLPENSMEHYPAEKVICPVSFSIWKTIPIDAQVCMVPDPDRIDLASSPRDTWVYAPTLPGEQPEEYELRMKVWKKIRDYRADNGRLVRYALSGLALRPKIVRHPLDRDAGAHVPDGPNPGHLARPGLGKPVTVTTTKKVRPSHDFIVSGVPIRVDTVTRTGFVGHKILE